MIKVSVIIPIYNMEKYIGECLDSIINQTLKEIEIICIDDCSNDNTLLLLENYKNKDNRIKLIQNTNNHGQGYSRNKGIKIAEGEYITFVDSDDFIEKNYLEYLYNTAKKYNSDIVSTLNIKQYIDGNIDDYFLTKDIKKKYIIFTTSGISNVSIIDEKYKTKEYLFGIACNKLCKRDFLINNNLFFMNIKNAPEDEDLYQRILLNNPKTSYNHKAIYFYRERNDSTMNSLNISNKNLFENSINTIKVMENSIDYCKNNNPELLNYIIKRSFNIISYRFTLFTENNYKKEFYHHLYEFCNKINLDKVLDKDIYNEIYLIKTNENYKDYSIEKLLKEVDKLKKEVSLLQYKTNWLRLFGININKEYINIILFGIKISIKK